MKVQVVLTILLLLNFSGIAQSKITPDDFKLCIDNYECYDSVLKITKKELLQLKKVTPNFSWFTIKKLTFYFTAGFGTDVNTATCYDNTFCSNLKALFERCSPGASITIVAEGENKAGTKINWGEKRIVIVE